jgi:hypothetical protein
VLGAGLGASAGIARTGAWLQSCMFSEHVFSSDYFGRWGENPMAYYLVFMFFGVFAGGLVSSQLANRGKIMIEKGSAVSGKKRLIYALVGGILAGFASRIAGGCTSGQALTGGAMLVNGSLIFMITCFAGGYGFAWFVRGQWHD